MHPLIFRPDTTIRLFCLIFPSNGQTCTRRLKTRTLILLFCTILPANDQVLHPSIEISNKGAVKLFGVVKRAHSNAFCSNCASVLPYTVQNFQKNLLLTKVKLSLCPREDAQGKAWGGREKREAFEFSGFPSFYHSSVTKV